MASIPASNIANINFNVLSAGGDLVSMNGVFITDNTDAPPNELLSFANTDDIAAYFGTTSAEYKMAVKYFLGYSISTTKPGRLYFYRISASATSGVLRSSTLGMTLVELQAIDPGTIIVDIDGVTKTSASIDLSGATSFSNAAALIEAGFTTPNFAVAYDSLSDQFTITSDSTGSSSTVSFASGTMADAIKLTEAEGATITDGQSATGNDVTAFMNGLVALTKNWATFTTTYEPVLAQMKSFADWVSTKNAEYAYIAWDTDATDTVVNPANDNIVNYLIDGSLDNTFVITKDPDSTQDISLLAGFVSGCAASIDFTAQNNRPTFAFMQQAGLVPSVTNETISQAIIDNGANFYGRWSTKNEQFSFMYPGQVSGSFRWMDDLINAIFMKATMQNTLISLLTSVPSIPYNQQGYQGLIATSLLGDINDFLNFGAIRVGVTLDSVQAAAVNNSAGRDITQPLFNKGYVLDVLDPGATVRGQRGSPIINLYYTSGGAVQKINMTATLIQ